MTYRTRSGKQFVVMATGVSDQNALVACSIRRAWEQLLELVGI